MTCLSKEKVFQIFTLILSKLFQVYFLCKKAVFQLFRLFQKFSEVLFKWNAFPMRHTPNVGHTAPRNGHTYAHIPGIWRIRISIYLVNKESIHTVWLFMRDHSPNKWSVTWHCTVTLKALFPVVGTILNLMKLIKLNV